MMRDVYDTIEAYIQDDLSEQEKLDFEHELESDKALFEEYQYHLLMKDILIESRIEHVQKILKERRGSGFGLKYLVGGVIFVLVSGGLFWKLTSLPSTKQLPVVAVDTLKPNEEITFKMQSVEERMPDEHKSEGIIPHQSRIVQAEKNDLLVDLGNNKNEPEEEQVMDSIAAEESKVDESENTKGRVALEERKVEQPKVSEEVISDTTEVLHEIVEEVPLEETQEEKHVYSDEQQVPQRINLEIAPEQEAYDEFPFINSETGILYIYSKNGKLVRQLEVIDGQPSFWDGADQNGVINAGYFIYKFEGASTQFIGGITVIY